MANSKVLCFVGLVFLVGFNEARPASKGQHVHKLEEEGGDGEGGKHVHRISNKDEARPASKDDGEGGQHVHKLEEGGDGGKHLHRISNKGDGNGGTHVHRYRISGGSGGGGGAADGGAGGAVGGGAGGGNIDQAKMSKIKKILSMLNIDLSQIDPSDLEALAQMSGGFGKDSLQPMRCDDSIDDRYGVGKHFVRGTRDVGFAIVSEARTIIDGVLGGIPLIRNLAGGLSGGLKDLLCAIESGLSDFGGDFDSATDIAKNGLANFFKLQGPDPILGIPKGIVGIAGETGDAAGSIIQDAVSGVENALGDVLSGL